MRGFTLIEFMITLTIIGIALTLAAPAYWEWIQNTQIRSATESMMVGIKLARAEALKRNASVCFQLMTTQIELRAFHRRCQLVRQCRSDQGRRSNVTNPSVTHYHSAQGQRRRNGQRYYSASDSQHYFRCIGAGHATPVDVPSTSPIRPAERVSPQRNDALSADPGHRRGSGTHVRPRDDGHQRHEKMLITT